MRVLMISSQLLLAIFLGYWLLSQFTEKKILLSEDLERGLRNSEQQVIDSMLSTNFIDPILSDTGMVSVFMSDFNIEQKDKTLKMSMDSIPHVMMRISGDHEMETIKKSQIISRIEIVDSTQQIWEEGIQSKVTMEVQHDTSKQILFQGIKLLINSVGNFNDEPNKFFTFLSTDVDTSLLIKIYNTSIEKDYEGFVVSWQPIAKGERTEDSITGIVIRSHLFENLYGPSVTGHQLYLTKSISPQIAFALILLIITTLAFRMAYVNLKNQRKLIGIKNDFISNITHELKTPVATVKVALEALLDFNMKEDPKLTKEYLEMAHSEMKRLDLLVNQVLNNSALEEGNTFVFPEETELKTIINDVLFSMQSRFDNQNAIISFTPPEEEILLELDKLHIHGVIVNLLDNSLKYTEQKPEIEIEITKGNKETKLTISDNGIGIPKEYIDKVFDKFFRVPKGDEHNVKGYGLGLNYAALVMEHHHGKVEVNCNEKGGCSFTLSFPNIQ